ncbi:unnamed protein product [Chilo suppressalis]|uniref:PAP-associated domain-containing protein n=1 Tax=Chilo suppressalis TaxID=168631 RepID=A0ABN8AVT8_CHISP|nr:unnamed protein product [Chilo suppressalis]
MSVLFQTVINTGKLFSFSKVLNASLSKCKCLSLRKYSDLPKKLVGFDDIVAQRRAEAKRSIIVQVNSDSSFNELYCYCSKYADINGIHHYRNSGGEHFMLVEFKSEECVRDVLRNCGSHQRDVDVMPSNSPFLWFRAVSGKKETSMAQAQTLLIKDGNTLIDDEDLYEELMKCSTVSEQIEQLYEKTRLNDLGVRLRYMVARHLEVLFSSLYTNVEVRPFGSSVNGFGKMGCDLDLILTSSIPEKMCGVDRRLVYQEKRCGGRQESWRRQLELAAEVMEARAAGARRVLRVLHARVPIVKFSHQLTGLECDLCFNNFSPAWSVTSASITCEYCILRVLHARVPIVKFSHQLTGLECDLCFNNLSGVRMSAWLYACGGLSPVVRPLTLSVRRWASAAGLTSPHPGRWITSFPLSLLVLFYLQQKRVLPPLKTLLRDAGEEDGRLVDDNGMCTFLRDLNELPPDSYGQCDVNLETLLLQFFEFYAQFDFQEKAISLNLGAAVRKPNSQPLYIINPLDQSLNVSRNVSYEECQKLQVEVRNAAWQLEAEMEGRKGEDWGLLGLFEKKASRNLKKLVRMGNSHRLVSIKDLFQDTDETPDNGLRSKLQGLTEKSDKEIENSVKEMKDELTKEPEKVKETVRFKNRQVASEVYRIRRDKIL